MMPAKESRQKSKYLFSSPKIVSKNTQPQWPPKEKRDISPSE
jgi:hypothetical protein